MTVKEAREDVIAKAQTDLDLYKGITLDADGNAIEESEGATALVWQAAAWWERNTYCSFDPSIALTLTADVDEYDCNDLTIVAKRILKPVGLMVNGSYLYRRDGREIGFWSHSELMRYRPSWRSLASGTPHVAVWYPTGKALLSAPPSDAFTGTNFFSAFTVSSPYSAGEDENTELPGHPEDHFYITDRAVVLGSLSVVAEPSARQRVADHDASVREEAGRRKRENMADYLGRRPRGDRAASDWMY